MPDDTRVSNIVIIETMVCGLLENMSYEELLDDEEAILRTLYALGLDILDITEFMTDSIINGLSRKFIRTCIVNSSEREFIDILHFLGKTIHDLVPLL